VIWQQHLGNLALMANELQLLRHQNRQVQEDLRAIYWGHRHFRQTLMIASMLNATGEPPELKSAKVEKVLSDTKAEMEAEVYNEELAMLSEGVPAEEIAEHHACFRTFIHNRIGNMRVSAHAVAERMQLGYGHAQPVIARVYADYVDRPFESLKQHYPVYQQNVSTFMQKHTAATRHLSGELWTHGTARMQGLAAQLSNQTGMLRYAISNAKDINIVISQADAVGMEQTLATLLQQNYVDGCSLAQNMNELKEQEQLISDLLTGKRNDKESIQKAAAFLDMEGHPQMLLRQINAYRKVHNVPEMKLSWGDQVRMTSSEFTKQFN
jgi:hypothetical protein